MMTRIVQILRPMVIAAAFAVAITSSANAFAMPAQAGDQSRWSLSFGVSLEQHSTRSVEIHLTGNLTSTVSEVRPGEYDAQLQLSDVSFTGDGVRDASPASLMDLRSRLTRPFWVTCRADGGLLAIHFFSDLSPVDQNLLQMIATEIQLVRPTDMRTSWTAQERDGAGEYMAMYVQSEPGRITKRKMKYTYVNGVSGAPADIVRIAIDQSDTSITLDSSGRVATLDGTNRVHMEFSKDPAGQLASRSEIHLSNLRFNHAPQLIGSLARAHSSLISSPITTHHLDPALLQAEADERLIHGASTESILQGAYSKDSSDGDVADRLAALFRRRPDASSDAAAILYKNGPQRRITNALGAVASLNTVTALAMISRNAKASESLRVDALIAFAQMQHPSAEAMRIPSDLLQDSNPAIRSAALMMCGALARAGRTVHPGEASALDAALISLYRDAHDPSEVRQMLGALGNSAGPTVVPVIEEALGDSRATIRAAAIRALRLAAGPHVDEVLANAMVSDPEPHVRSDAIFTVQFRHPLSTILADALLQAATSDKADYVRSSAVSAIRQNPAASPRIAETLAQIADNDSNSGIRRQATNALASIQATPTQEQTR